MSQRVQIGMATVVTDDERRIITTIFPDGRESTAWQRIGWIHLD